MNGTLATIKTATFLFLACAGLVGFGCVQNKQVTLDNKVVATISGDIENMDLTISRQEQNPDSNLFEVNAELLWNPRLDNTTTMPLKWIVVRTRFLDGPENVCDISQWHEIMIEAGVPARYESTSLLPANDFRIEVKTLKEVEL